ncbi:hypothetical protein VTJ49DRAFT_7223 [Mycothermus thermophilus]|uniref:DUF6314 domain-containing protein n=1 Tax=Humicola insolens TaxID=85995 RepID=A0ABR3VQE9_HUMIN
MSKRVCIVGAGPSGLVAAKSLLHDAPRGTFDVTVFDSQSRIGGLWPADKADNAGLVHPRMVANQSKHTVQFSDLTWPQDSPQLPRAWQVGEYLARYRDKYLSGAKLRLGTRVEKAEPLVSPQLGWRVQTHSNKGETKEEMFDYLLIASGYFGRPALPPVASDDAQIPVIHSSQYRDLPSLLGKTGGQGTKILVVGGQMSGVEIAGTIASHLSSVVNSPGRSGHISLDAAKLVHSIYQRNLGTDQEIFSSAVAINGDDTDSPPYLAVSDYYMDFVRSGLITVSRGRLAALSDHAATLAQPNGMIKDVAAVVLATGFEASSSLSFLPASVQKTLALDPSDLNNTVALGFHGTYHPDIPNLGFVGFYRSPYWGVMEMQARFLTAMWTAGGPASPSIPVTIRDALAKDDSIERTLRLRTDSRASQFPMGDYAWLMQEFASALGLTRSAPPPDMPMDILTPARYVSASATKDQLAEAHHSLEQTEAVARAGLTNGRFVARAVFRSLLGEWKLDRRISSRLPSHPSGHFRGTARFLLREGTGDGREATFYPTVAAGQDPGWEYMYVEEGDFEADNGLTFRATRRYVWRYDEEKDKLSVWFARTDDPKRADYLFHEVEFVAPAAGQGDDSGGWEANAGHLCIEDFYDVQYLFNFKAVNLSDWSLGYTVKGPKKDYTIEGRYSR